MAGKGDGLLRDAFHQVAIRGEDIGVVVHEIGRELGVQMPLGKRKANRCRKTLPQRTGCHFNTWRVPYFRMARRFRAPLAEILELIQRHPGRAGKIEDRIKQHRAVTGRENKAIPIRPMGVRRVKLQKPRVDDGRNIGCAHWQAWMTGFGLFHPIHRKATNGIGHAACKIARTHHTILLSNVGD